MSHKTGFDVDQKIQELEDPFTDISMISILIIGDRDRKKHHIVVSGNSLLRSTSCKLRYYLLWYIIYAF